MRQGSDGHGPGGCVPQLSEALQRHRLHDDIGIRLLHKHNDVEPRDIMIEREAVDGDGDFCLTTIASRVPDVGNAQFANS